MTLGSVQEDVVGVEEQELEQEARDDTPLDAKADGASPAQQRDAADGSGDVGPLRAERVRRRAAGSKGRRRADGSGHGEPQRLAAARGLSAGLRLAAQHVAGAALVRSVCFNSQFNPVVLM